MSRGNDPFAIFLKPPKNETSTERATRRAIEAEAQRRSDAIDEELRRESQRSMRTRGRLVKAVLIGESESGRSEMVKHLRMRYAREEWDAELLKWKSVIQLKVLKAVKAILDALQSELDGGTFAESPDNTPSNGATEYPLDMPPCSDAAPSGTLESWSSGNNDADASAGDCGSIQDKYWLLLLRLTPIRYAEESLRRWFGPSDATDVIARCQEDIKILWMDEMVQSVLGKSKIKLEESGQFFLDNLDRIASRDYAPSDEDVARVYSRTGIQEYWMQLQLEQMVNSNGCESEIYVRLYDIGNWNAIRHTWTPFHEEVDIVMFFASLSTFNERSPEDPKINRLEHSFLLWRTICGSRLLNKSCMVLFLTECDVLRSKLKSGVNVKDYVPSYRDRPNEVLTAVKYFGERFRHIAKASLGPEFSLYIYPVSTVDSEAAVRITISTVKEIVLRGNLECNNLV